MTIGRGVSELWRVENLPLPLTSPMAYMSELNCQYLLYSFFYTKNFFPGLIMTSKLIPRTAKTPVEINGEIETVLSEFADIDYFDSVTSVFRLQF